MKIAVVGAGIMGRLLAFSLHAAGYQLSIFAGTKAQQNANCSMAAAGMLTPFGELEKSNSLIYHLGQEALQTHWPRIIGELQANIYFQRSGSLILAHPRDTSDLERFIAHIQYKLPPAQHRQYCQKLTSAEVQALEPELSKFEQGYYFSEEAQLDNQALMPALKAYLVEHGLHWRVLAVDEVLPGAIRINNKTEHFDLVFDCRGLGAKAIFPDLQGIRGELIWLHAPEVNIKRLIRLQHPRHGLYIVPRPHHVYLLGASEIHAENYAPISVRSTLELLTAAFYVHPGFAEARMQKTVTECRPTFPDYLPRIKYFDGLIAINGLYRHGFLIAPSLADEVLRWLQGGKSALHYPQIGEFCDSSSLQ